MEYISKDKTLKKLQMQLLDLEADQDKGEYSELCENRGARDALDGAINDIRAIKGEDVQPVNQWISVKDRLPEAVEEDVNGKIAFSELVLVYLVYDNGFTFITVDKCNTDKKRWLHEIPGEGCKVTHWQPLPEPPKDGEHNG